MKTPSVFRILSASGGEGVKYTRIEIERILPEGESLAELPRDCLVFSGDRGGRRVSVRKSSSGGYELKGIPFKALLPGSFLVPQGCGFSVSRSLCLISGSQGAIPSSGTLKTLFGSFPVSCNAFDKRTRVFSCRAKDPLGAFPLMECVYESERTSSLSARVLHTGHLRPESLRLISKAVFGLPRDSSDAEILGGVFSALGCIRAPEDFWISSSRRFGAFLLNEVAASTLLRKIERLALREGGFPADELSGSLDIEPELAGELADFLIGEEKLVKRGRFLLPGGKEKAGLSPLGRAVLARLTEAGVKGLPLPDLSASGDVIDNLGRMGLLVVLDRWLVLSKQSYDCLIVSLTGDARPGDRLTIEDAKRRTGLSRRYALDVLNRLEENGIMERRGDYRVFL